METVGRMVCPRDASRLSKIGFLGINLDSCPNCDGVWLEKGELARLHGLRHDLLPGAGGEDPRGQAPCPFCHETMDTRYFSHVSKVLLDQCPRCLGIWLDQAELTLILREVYKLKENATVYLSGRGKCYHTHDCPRAGSSAEPVSFVDAQARGKHPCKQCKPPEIEVSAPA